MPQHINNKNVYSLSEVTSSIKRTLTARYGSQFWVKAEMSKLNKYDYSGHCYPDLVEREQGRMIAQMRGIIWAADFRRINTSFVEATGENLSDGMQIMLEASVSFDANHGLSLVIHNIDPSFTIGEMELEKRRCIMRLKSEGLWDLNRSLPMPILPKRIAIISVTTSKGFADFISLLNARSQGFALQHVLFPAILQGEKAVEQITAQLERIRSMMTSFDVVAIIRGGGGETGLSAFNHYNLASAVAAFPLPVLTGIGHATNLTVTEMVAHTRAITPTELADLLLERFEYINNRIQQAVKAINNAPTLIEARLHALNRLTQQLGKSATATSASYRTRINHWLELLRQNTHHALATRHNQVDSTAMMLKRLSPIILNRNTASLNHMQTRLILGCGSRLGISRHQLETLASTIDALHPTKVLNRGFSITRHKGHMIRNANQLEPGLIIETQLAHGFIQSIITETEPQ